MFDLYYLTYNHNWKLYYQSKDIDLIYRTIELLNYDNITTNYRIDVDNRVFVFLDTSEYKLNFMREHYNTNEKCKPRYVSDDYDLGYEKIKRR